MGDDGSTTKEILLLRLTEDGAPAVPQEYVYLPPPTDPPYILRVEIDGSSKICHQGSLWINVPKDDQSFERQHYTQYKLRPDFHGCMEIDIPITTAGAFAYYVTYERLPSSMAAEESAHEVVKTRMHYIDVGPRLTLNGKTIPLDALSIFSVVSRFMGAYPEVWERHLKGIAQREYNMVHFTPLVQRGESDSPYSLYNQHEFDTACFPNGDRDIAEMVEKMEKREGLLSLTDVVWNHTASNSIWLETHPEAGYNIETAPWLEAALELDSALLDFGDNLAQYGLSSEIKNAGDLSRIIAGMHEHVIQPLNLWQYYIVNVEASVKDALSAWKDDQSIDVSNLELPTSDWSTNQKSQFVLEWGFVGANTLGPRFSRKPASNALAMIMEVLYGPFESDKETAARNGMTELLNEINIPFYAQYDEDVKVVSQQIFDRVRYLRLDDDGPKWGPISKSSPFIETYFSRLPVNERTKEHNPKSLALVCNGWIWAADALKDHAGPDSRSYLRREVIVWSDCVKLRYGGSPKDNPYLWEFMAKYTRLMAKYFAGFRIDNCHSTPLVVAEYLLDQARKVRPNLAVFAELFTGSEQMDYVFVKRLGISSLIREAMQSGSTQEMSRLVHMHAGRPIGSFDSSQISHRYQGQEHPGVIDGNQKSPKITLRRVQTSPINALFMDCTHDNEMPTQKRDARDTLPNAALVSMCAAATGSVMGYDEIYPKAINIVLDKRTYYSPSSDHKVIAGPGKDGIGGLKKLFNEYHTMMALEGYEETFIDHQGEFITVHRVHSKRQKGIFLAAHTAYPGCGEGHGNLRPVFLDGSVAKPLGCWKLDVDCSDSAMNAVAQDTRILKGLPSHTTSFDGVNIDVGPQGTTLRFSDGFSPGSVAMFETVVSAAEHIADLDEYLISGVEKAFSALDFVDLNFVLYRCEAEEQDSSLGQESVYTIPQSGPLVYAGLQGWWSVLKTVIRDNDLGHPVCDHLRAGKWALDYIVNRLEKVANRENRPSLMIAADWFRDRFAAVKKLPSYLVPKYFAMIIQGAYKSARGRSLQLFGSFIRHGQPFLQDLAMTSIQMSGTTKSASLVPSATVPCLAAGLPHFSSSWARCWGRDIFIALRGLYLCTGRFEDAKAHIKAFASVMKHGMVPNLLGDGRAPRYNARDAIWFFLQNIQDYTTMAPSGLDILQETVKRRFLPYDDVYFDVEDARAYSKTSTIEEIIQEGLTRHAEGLHFREANAGPGLDMQMKSEGFDIDVHVDWKTGFIFGGNQFNCGTWMDKMGESDKADSKGVPGTPRDGAAIELTGLLYSTLVWLAELHKTGHYRHEGINLRSGQVITFAAWAEKIANNFEKCYYIPSDISQDTDHDVNTSLVHRRGIYKDLYRSGKEYEDYQFRPNFPIAMAVAPTLFKTEHALAALRLADEVLRGPTGMATLDPSDYNYRPYYNNSEDSTDFATSKGRNYHQGPEWLWPTGFFLRALLHFEFSIAKTVEQKELIFQEVSRRLDGCKNAIEVNPWAGLAELTNKDGAFCHDSSPTQAWSSSCLIDLYWDAKALH